MSRLKQNRIIDGAIHCIATISQSQYSLSERDLIVVNEALERLQFLRRKKGRTNKQIRNEIVEVTVLLTKIFAKD